MYPYDLGIQIGTGRLCRIWKYDPIRYASVPDRIPYGFARVTKIRSAQRIKGKMYYSGFKLSPYINNELEAKYWSAYRWNDLVKQLDR